MLFVILQSKMYKNGSCCKQRGYVKENIHADRDESKLMLSGGVSERGGGNSVFAEE